MCKQQDRIERQKVIIERLNSIGAPIDLANDFTDGGATVKTTPGTSLPRSFLLDLTDGRRFNCECIDRTKDIVDLKFGMQVRWIRLRDWPISTGQSLDVITPGRGGCLH